MRDFYIAILFLSFGLMSVKLYSQFDEVDNYYEYDGYYDDLDPVQIFELNFKLSSPLGAFSRNRNGRVFGGMGLHYLRQLNNDSPFFVKGNIDFSIQNSFCSDVRRIVNFFEEDWDATTVSYVMNFGLGVRYYPPQLGFWKIDPFIELNTGFNWFLTSTYFSRFGGDETESIIEGGNLAFFLESAAGINYRLSDKFYFVFKVGYLQGLAADYYIRNGVVDVLYSSFEAFEKKRSATDMLNFCLGISYAF